MQQERLLHQQSVYHNYIAFKLKEKFKFQTNIKRKQVREFLYPYAIPKPLRNTFIKEMEQFGLIKIKDKQNIELLV